MPYEITYRNITEGNNSNPITVISETASIDIYPVIDGHTYEITVVAINSLGIRSSARVLPLYTVIGKVLPPADVSGFSVTFMDSGIFVKWNPNTDIDLSGYELRKGTSWDTGSILFSNSSTTSFTDIDVLSGINAYWIKAVDTTGNYSANVVGASLLVLYENSSSGKSAISLLASQQASLAVDLAGSVAAENALIDAESLLSSATILVSDVSDIIANISSTYTTLSNSASGILTAKAYLDTGTAASASANTEMGTITTKYNQILVYTNTIRSALDALRIAKLNNDVVTLATNADTAISTISLIKDLSTQLNLSKTNISGYSEEISLALASVQSLIENIRVASGVASVTFNTSGQAIVSFDTFNDPQIIEYELRVGSSFENGLFVDKTTSNTFTISVLNNIGNTYWIRAKYETGYSTKGYKIDFSGNALSTPTNISWKIVEPNIVFMWDPVAGASQYLILWEVGGISLIRLVTNNEVSLGIPKYSTVFRIIAMTSSGAVSNFADEELNISGQYRQNELVNAPINITGGKYVNLAFTTSNTVKRVGLLGTTPVAPYAQNINDADLYSLGYNLNSVVASQFTNTPASWFRDNFWQERTGYFESVVKDLGAVYNGILLLNISKTVVYVGNSAIDTWKHVNAEYLANNTINSIIDIKAFLTAKLYVATDSEFSSSWKEVNNGDWVSARYVKFVIEVAMASPLTDITISNINCTIDVPDITESGSVTGVTVAGMPITFSRTYKNVSIIIATARGVAKAYTGNRTSTGCTLYVDSGTQQVDYFVKGY